MKKIVSIVLSLCVLTSFLGGCATSDQNESDLQSSAITTDFLTPAENQISESEENETSEIRVFGCNRSDLVNYLCDCFDRIEYPNAFNSEPLEADGGSGRTAYIYTIDSCSQCYFYASSDNDKLCKFVLMSNSNKMDEYAMKTFSCYVVYMIGFLASEEGFGKVDENLAISSTPFNEDTINFYSGLYSDFSYTIVNGILTLTIEPRE